uniref:Uncharacterized protein n=1 Tax=Anguilla anguilla TaxID=7936 RepID=A0A0E9XPZ8_ANGAN
MFDQITKPLHHVCMLCILSCSHTIPCLKEQQAICVNEQVYLIRWPLSVYTYFK